MATHNDLGRWGETTAASFLLEKGFKIIAKNYRNWQSEIDLIVTKDEMLIFVEVKTRSGTAFGMPEEFVNGAKAKLIMRAAEQYIFDIDWETDVRFDIVSVLTLPDGSTEIRHIEDAFSR
ncbi:putative endonuclease [Dyadobacter sp. SG02]|uniref:YraN family protein n=1 Tax=Dyadobacter sp. SG02 TaxID=1855291 RepID=UPI0008B1756B|nr:YraN family protein [Dyadobacter sp. SG02]SEJ82347.1 putative endonuclease [Dyadobacter sp. SG02]